ncbi:MAG: type II toxin-antitoxin system HicB family antitoxin [Candidatus Aenigmarchaeota archaeon]|nr:type II toxin-antitoxin system HicB family antitoxin [Candidatus Aenigmarchaeota archaeon]
MTELILTCIIKKEKVGGYSSLCPELDVASRGNTIEEAKKNLEEAVEGHLKTAEQEGMLNDILQMLGITKKDMIKTEHISIPSFSSSLTIPLPV